MKAGRRQRIKVRTLLEWIMCVLCAKFASPAAGYDMLRVPLSLSCLDIFKEWKKEFYSFLLFIPLKSMNKIASHPPNCSINKDGAWVLCLIWFPAYYIWLIQHIFLYGFYHSKKQLEKCDFWVRKGSLSRWTDIEVQTKDCLESSLQHEPDAPQSLLSPVSSDKEGDHHVHVVCQAAFCQPCLYFPISYLFSRQSCTKTFLSAKLALCSTRKYLGNLSKSTTFLDALRGQWALLGIFCRKILWKHFPAILSNPQQPLSPWLSGSKVIISTCNGPSQLSPLAFLQLLFRSN